MANRQGDNTDSSEAGPMRLGNDGASLRRLLPIVLSQAVGLICGVVGIKITSRFIDPHTYGAYGLFISLAPLGMWVVHAGLGKFVVRHWAASPDRRGLMREVAVAAARKLPILAVITLAATLLMAWLGVGEDLPSPFGLWWAGWLVLFFAAAMGSISMLAQSALQAGREHWRDFSAAATGSVTRSFGPPLLYVLVSATLLTLQVGFAIHALAQALVAVWAVWGVLGQSKSGRPLTAPAKQLTPVYDGSLFVVLAVAAWVLTAVNRWIIAGFFGSEHAGFFTLASNTTLIVTGMLGVVFMQYWQPMFYATAASSNETTSRRALASLVDRVALAYMVCGLIGVAALRGVIPWLIGPLIDVKYASALVMVAPAGCFGVALGVAQYYHVLLLAGQRERACGWVDSISAAVLVGGGLLAAALGGETWFLRWLLCTPIIPLVLTRTMARREYLK